MVWKKVSLNSGFARHRKVRGSWQTLLNLIVFLSKANAYAFGLFFVRFPGAPLSLLIRGRGCFVKIVGDEARRITLLNLVRAGCGVHEAMEKVGRARSWYQRQRTLFPDWAAEVDGLRFARGPLGTNKWERDGSAIHEVELEAKAGGFEAFCRDYLGIKLFWHQMQWVDILEGREPRNLHPSQVYEPGDPRMIIINTPPDHAKSMTISQLYVVYLLCTNPDIRVKVCSKTDRLSQQFMYNIQRFLTHPSYAKLQDEFGPPEGYKAAADKWRASMLYLGGNQRTASEADPNVQALGLGQQIYGTRSDLIILDDCVTLANAHEYEKQIRWIQQEVNSRGGAYGKVLVVGTRVDGMDLYKALREPARYPNGASPWTYLSQPAVLEFAESPDEWVTLWPRSDRPWPGSFDRADNDGLYPRWPGSHLAHKRNTMDSRTWGMAYMQQDFSDDQVFPPELVRKAVNGMRAQGPMQMGAPGHRAKGMDGLYVVGGFDPAMAGDSAAVVLGLDRHTGMRYVLDAAVKTAASPTWIRETIKEMTLRLRVAEWRIEKNAFQGFLVQDPELKQYLGKLGVVITEHFTGRNKYDVAYGVAAMSALFHNNLIDIPSTAKSEACKQLCEQLVIWNPESKGIKTDLVMATWFAEIKCKEIMQASLATSVLGTHLPNRYANRRRKAQQHTVHLADLAAIGSGVSPHG